MCSAWTIVSGWQRAGLCTVEVSCAHEEVGPCRAGEGCEHQGRPCPLQLEEASPGFWRKSQRAGEQSVSGAGVRTLVMAIGRNRYTEEQRLGDTVQTARGAVSKVCCVKCTSCIKNIKFRNWVWWHIPIIPALGFGQKNQKFKDTTETCLTNK